MLKINELQEIFSIYNLNWEQLTDIITIQSGHINDTFVLNFSNQKKYLLQKINTYVFKKPEQLMKNIELIVEFSQKKLNSHFLKILHTKDNKCFTRLNNNQCYRIYYFVENSIHFDQTENEKICKNAGFTIGNFLNLLSDFPTQKLHYTIKNFHNTEYRYQTFLKILRQDKMQRKKLCEKEIAFVENHKELASKINNLLDTHCLPLKVTHNDTKINNILFDKQTLEGLCMIDLDTVMPGTIIYDFGDAIRSLCTGENEDKPENIYFNKKIFISFTEGFIQALKPSLCESEIQNLVIGAIVITYECGMRFLTDFLDGDHYFKIDYDLQNLNRCRSQFQLVEQMLKQQTKLEKIVDEIYKKED